MILIATAQILIITVLSVSYVKQILNLIFIHTYVETERPLKEKCEQREKKTS